MVSNRGFGESACSGKKAMSWVYHFMHGKRWMKCFVDLRDVDLVHLMLVGQDAYPLIMPTIRASACPES